jgi:hypothetical protein
MPSSKKTFTVTDQRSQSNADRQAWRNRSAEERLDAVEQLRIEAGKFLYEYPVRLRRLLAITQVKSRNIEELS